MNDEENQDVLDDTRRSAPKKPLGERAKSIGNKTKKVLGKVKKTATWGKLAPILAVVGPILVIIFVAIGIYGFMITLPGLSAEKITTTSKNFWKWLSNDDSIEVDPKEMNELAKYIEDLGYDVVGFGFAQSVRVDEDGNIIENDDKSITNVRYSNIYSYILANERTYTLTGRVDDWVFDTITFGGLRRKISGIAEVFNGHRKSTDKAHFGMIGFDNSWLTEAKQGIDGFSASIDREKSQLVIETGRLSADRMSFDMSGWTARYGKPIELSLALHLSTLAPDFVFDFCMDNDLQTKILLTTQKATYKDMQYSYLKEGANKIAKKDDVEEYCKQIEKEQDDLIQEDNLFNSKIALTKNNFEGYLAPVDVLFDTSIISVQKKGEDNNYGNKEYYRAVDKDKNPISFTKNYEAKIDNEGVPFFEVKDDGNVQIPKFVTDSLIEDSNVMLSDGTKIRLEIISLNDLITLDKLGMLREDGNREVIELQLANNITPTVEALDNYINNTVVKNKDEFKKESLEFSLNLKTCNVKDAKYDSWTFNVADDTDKKDYKEHNAEEVWKKIISNATIGNNVVHFEDAVNKYNFQNWLKDEISEIKANRGIIDQKFISDELRQYLSDINMDLAELIELNEVFDKLDSKVETYIPYIKNVTHHWFKDAYFIDDDFDAYERDVTKSINEEFTPDAGFSSAKMDEFMQNGKFYYNGSTENGIEQTADPKLVKDEPWHYKVKNWIEYGYYFIYDGSEKTAIDNELAIGYLKKQKRNNSDEPLYDPENPLILSEYGEGVSDEKSDAAEKHKELSINGAGANKIDKEAKKINKILEKGGFKARLQKIKFDKQNSLTAFSILENVHTEDTDLIYRDLKEFLVDLGYFKYSDFEEIETDVLEWLLPDYQVYKDEWPDLKYEILDKEYGRYIRSKLSIDTQRNREKEEARKKEEEEGKTPSDNETEQLENIVNSSGVVYEENTNSELHCDSTTTINGVRYCNYKQGYSEWAGNKFSGGNMASSACGATACAVILSGYGKAETPVDTAEYLEAKYGYPMDTAVGSLIDTLNHFGVSASQPSANAEEIRKAWSEGKPVIYNTGSGQITNEGHYFVVLGEIDEGVIISQVGGSGYSYITNNYIYKGDLETLIANNPLIAIIVPDEAPDGVSFSSSASPLPETVGFETGIDVIMPENGKIIEIGKVEEDEDNNKTNSENKTNNNKQNTNTEETDVEINANDTSDTEKIITKGDYVVIEFQTANGINGWKMRIEGFDLDTVNVKKDMILKQGDVIGITNEYNMKLILYDTKDAIINNVEDYFVLQKREEGKRSNIVGDKYEFFYFCIYESGVLSVEGNGPESVGACRPGIEHGVGICQWTTTTDSGLSNIQKVCENLYNLDNNLCAPLQKYIGMDNSTLINEYGMKPSFENSILRQDFKSICNKDRDKFLELQMQIAMEEKYEIFDDLGLSWIKERPTVVQGTLASLVNWGPALGWEDKINESMSDEQIIINLLKYACTINSTVGSLNSRWNPQAKAALDILHGEIDAEKFCTDAEYSAPYSTGTNGNFLSTQ